ncbi:hypothetical protein [Rhizobium laguerreae]|uniref:hypothetical protein n=1 Tax=Rhizobium laguerreae TaxID=1076926 RepID=UPI0014429A77|nr:hypothetical protein [Rhizobium laguerreae]NKN12292.1 hypothetical protein [Rhizobium laguerreae]
MKKSARKLFSTLENVELLAITHVDEDVSGGVTMFNEKRPLFSPKDVWFNARRQLMQAARHPHATEVFSPQQGEKITQGIARYQWPHNSIFAGGPIATDISPGGDWVDIGGGARLLLLSPDRAAMAEMLDIWDAALAAAGLRASDPDVEETAPPRGFETFSSVPPNVELLAQAGYFPTRGPQIARPSRFWSKWMEARSSCWRRQFRGHRAKSSSLGRGGRRENPDRSS